MPLSTEQVTAATWFDALPPRLRTVIRNEFEQYGRPLTKEDVRALGREYWLHTPGMGITFVDAIAKAVGGFANRKPKPPTLRNMMDRLEFHTARLYAITGRLDAIEVNVKAIREVLEEERRNRVMKARAEVPYAADD